MLTKQRTQSQLGRPLIDYEHPARIPYHFGEIFCVKKIVNALRSDTLCAEATVVKVVM